jgi:hypothetical protein
MSALTMGLVAGPAQAATAPTALSARHITIAVDAYDAQADLYLMTPAQYNQVKQAKAEGLTVTPQTITPPPNGGPWYEIISTAYDTSHRTIPIRQGFDDQMAGGGTNSGGGYLHACIDHNLCNPPLVNKLFNDNTPISGPTSNNRYTYDLYVVDDNLDIDLVIQGIQSQSRTGPDNDTTPDGLPFGLVTAYCENYTMCPAAINSI